MCIFFHWYDWKAFWTSSARDLQQPWKCTARVFLQERGSHKEHSELTVSSYSVLGSVMVFELKTHILLAAPANDGGQGYVCGWSNGISSFLTNMGLANTFSGLL